ncbi:hypothetical protein [Lentzea roselyniae]|uniref:hypothetical protein n=1 Tax=Lentzea roselyniae TaxID=531940 RepID=UPI0031F7B9F1
MIAERRWVSSSKATSRIRSMIASERIVIAAIRAARSVGKPVLMTGIATSSCSCSSAVSSEFT